MNIPPEEFAEEIKHLQHRINDLISVLALPAVWSGAEPSQIVHTLLDALLGMLQLDLIYVHLKAPDGQVPIEMVRFASTQKRVSRSAHEIGEHLYQTLGAEPQDWPPLVRASVTDRDLSIVPLGLGLQGEIGVIVAASERADFPRQTERLVLSVAANQASIALQEARLRSAQQRVASELDRRVAQRTAELATANEELRKEIAERKHAEEDLKNSEEKYRVMVDAANDAVISMDGNGKIQFANPATARIFGHDPMNLIGRPMTVLMPESMRKLHDDGFKRYLATGHRQINWHGTELTALHKNGHEFPVEVAFGELASDGHNVFTGFIRDISERKQAENKLRASERSLRELTETIPQMLWSAEADGTVNYCNQRTLDYTGLSAAQVRSSGWLTAVHSDDVEATTRAWLDSVTSGEAFQREFRFRRVPGGYRWCISSAVPLRDPEGKLIRWFGTVVDLHDWREAQQALLAIQTRQVAVRGDVSLAFGQKETLETILHECAESIVRHLDAAFARIWTLSRDGKMLELRASAGLYTHLNGAHSRIPIGQLKIGLIARDQKHILTNDIIHDPRISDQAWAVKEGMSSFAGYPLLVGTRTLGVIAMFSRKPLTTGTAETLVSIADLIAHGIERKRAEDELHASERRLQAARTELARISRLTTMGELAASIAHEVNQPLTAVVNNGSACLRLLASRNLEPDVLRQALEGIVADGTRASAVLARIRAFIRKESAEKNKLDINQVIQEVLILAGRELYENQVLLDQQLTTDLPFVLADRIQLQQVLLNLVMNGVEAMATVTDRPRLLAVRSRTDDSRDVLVAVSDSGTGFGPEVDRVFTPFFTTKANGMGMGLSISRSLVESHGGRLWAAPNSPHGAVFSFTLPTTAGDLS